MNCKIFVENSISKNSLFKLFKEYIWAWKLTGSIPKSVKFSEIKGKMVFEFSQGMVSYFCYPDIDGFYHIGNVDMDGLFDIKKYKKKAYLIEKYLKIKHKPSKKEAVLICAKAISIIKKHKNETIDTSNFSLQNCQHSIINFG